MEHSASLRAFLNYQHSDSMHLKLILAFIVTILFSSCASTVYVMEDSGPMVMPHRPAPVTLGATAPGLHLSLNPERQCYPPRPIATRPHYGAYSGGNYGYLGNGGAYYGGAGGYPGYQQGRRYNSTTHLPPVHPNVYGRRNGTAVTDPRNGSWNGFRTNPANAYLFR